MEQDKRAAATLRLLKIMDELRAKCPWDRKQTFETLRGNTIEETYELADAILDRNMEGIREELGEVEAEMKSGSKTDLEGEFGDLLFALVNACRLYGVDPESALERTNKKFIQRFNYMEERAAAKGHTLHEMSLGAMEELWQEAKRN